MVFESLVADLLNRYIGEYVQNLDKNQLKIGIWGGDVVLKNLILKQSALDELNLPIRTIYGRLGQLTLKIPWKNLYSSPVEASVDTLYLLAVPNQEIKYDPVKEDQWAQDAKQKELDRVELAKQQEKEKEEGKEKAQDSFVEKLATQIIRNVQVFIKKIHIRYEDRITNPRQPFAAGITLYNLTVHTTDENWTHYISSGQETSSMIYKMLNLEAASVYWNTDTKMFSEKDPSQLEEFFLMGIADKAKLAPHYQYILGPINAVSRLRINTKPESDFSLPKITLELDLERLQVRLGKDQYKDLIRLVDSLNHMSKATMYRKYRPALEVYQGFAKEWWHFAYTCILEEQVRRRRRNWEWSHMQEHRRHVHAYETAWRAKLTTAKPTPDLLATVEQCERALDVMNIILVRQKVENQVARETHLQAELKASENKGWLGGWLGGWGAGSNQARESKKNELVTQFEEAMTHKEKEKLYKAIGYQETALPAVFPESFVEAKCSFVMHCLEVEIRDEELATPRVLIIVLKQMKADLEKRPVSQALKIATSVEVLSVFGLAQGDKVPQLVTSKRSKDDGHGTLLEVLFEVNPACRTCDQRIHVTAKPLQVVYDAKTLIQVSSIFTPDQSEADVMYQLQEAAATKMIEFKEMSALGLQNAITRRTVLDLNVRLQGSYLLIPHGGHYTGTESLLVVNLGSIAVTSSKIMKKEEINVAKMHKAGTSEQEILRELIAKSYDQFIVELNDLQVMVTYPGERWLKPVETDLYVLRPTSVTVNLDKCLIMDDPRLPRLKVLGELSEIHIKMAETRLLRACEILLSIPQKQGEAPPLDAVQELIYSSVVSLRKVEMKRKRNIAKKEQRKGGEENLMQFTDMELTFLLKEFIVSLEAQKSKSASNGNSSSGSEVPKSGSEVARSGSVVLQPLLELRMADFELRVTQKTFDMIAFVRLGGLGLVQFYKKNEIQVLSTPVEEALFSVEYNQINRKSPEFRTKYNSCLQVLDVNFSKLVGIIHQEALLEMWRWISDVLQVVNKLNEEKNAQTMDKLGVPKLGPGAARSPGGLTAEKVLKKKSVVEAFTSRVASAGAADSEDTEADGLQDKRKTFKKVATATKLLSGARLKKELEDKKRAEAAKEITDLRITLNMGDLNFSLHSERYPLASFDIDGIHLAVVLKRSCTKLKVTLDNLAMFSSLPDSIYTQILSVPENLEALKADITLYNSEDGLTEVEASIAQCRLVFLNRFTTALLEFINQFQAGKQAIIEASQAAVASAKQNLQDMYAAASKVSLDISIAAPVLVIPASSTSLDAIVMDFGNLTMKNQFETLAVKNVKGHPAVLDHCRMELDNMTMSRVLYADSSLTTVEDIVLIRPINFSLLIIRNLCAGWHKSVPDLNVSGQFQTINLSVSREDYATLMRISSGNLAEGAPPVAPVSAGGYDYAGEPGAALGAADLASISPDSVQSPEDPNTAVLVTPTTAQKSPTIPDDPTRKSMVFAFSMDSLVLELRAQAAFTLSALNIEGEMYADASIKTRVVLKDCLLDDTRVLKKAKKVSRYMERKRVSGTDMEHMIEVLVHQSAGKMNTDLRICSFNLILNLDFILKTLDFVTVPADASKVPPGALVSKAAPTPSSKPAPVPAQDNVMTLNLRLEKPDLILVENLDDLDTNAIIMNTEMTCKVVLHGQRQVIDGTIKDLQIYSCIYNPLKRDETMSQILRPVTISLAGSTPEAKGLHLEVCATPLLMSVSPATIEMLNRINSTIFTTQEQEEAALEEVDHSELWTQKQFAETDYWFLKTERAVEALEDLTGGVIPLDEICIVSMPRIVITLEAGLPMILTQLSFQAKARNWSSKLAVESVSTLQVRYYNLARALWEPMIEPVERNPFCIGSHAPWEVEMTIETNDNRHVDTEEEFKTAKPGKIINITSKQNMEITITKTCLNVLTDLGKAFNEAINVKPCSKSQHQQNPPQFIIENYLGIPIIIDIKALNCTATRTCAAASSDQTSDPTSDHKVELNHLETVELNLNSVEEARDLVLALESDELVEQYIQVEIPGRNQCSQDSLQIPVSKADKRYYPLKNNCNGWAVVCDINIQDATSIVKLRSNVQVFNHLGIDINLFTQPDPGSDPVLSIPADQHASLPLPHLTSCLFFSTHGSLISSPEFRWTQLQNAPSIHELVRSEPKNIEDSDPTFLNLDGELEQIYFENTNKFTMVSNNYKITVRPTVVIKNNLPLPITLLMQGVFESFSLPPGQTKTLVNVEPGTSSLVTRIDDYLEKRWICKKFLEKTPEQFNVWRFESFDSAEAMALNLGMHVTYSHSTLLMDLYCPFWMINKTELMLTYKPLDDSGHVLYHPPSYKGTIMFSYKEKAFFGKKKACIKVENGDWSDKFSLDVVGSSGCVDCTYRGKVYHVGVHINLTSNSLTKVVLFTPYYVIINNCSFDVEFTEVDKDHLDNTDMKPVLVPSHGCTSYWPPTQHPGKDKKVDPGKKMRVRVVECPEFSPPFPYSVEFNDLLKFKNRFGAVNAEVHVTESSAYITFSEYRNGMAPLLIINHTSEDIDVHERYSEEERVEVKAGHKVYWAWSQGAGQVEGETDRSSLVWAQRKVMADGRRDGLGEFFLDDDFKKPAYWTCFLDGIQRVLLITEDALVFTDVRASGNYELFDQEIVLSMHRIGVSLVDNERGYELLYLNITSSGIIWESQKSEGKRFKQLSIVDSNDLENAFIMYNNQLVLQETVSPLVRVSPEMEVNFVAFTMLKPNKRRLRRVYNSGLWLQMRSSSVSSQLHIKLHRLQIDNQLQDAIYPVIMAPVPLPKTIAANHVLKPFVEVSIVQRLNVNSQVRQYKYYKVLIQEFHVKVELSSVTALGEFFASQQTSKEAVLAAFQQDIKKIETPLLDHVALHTVAEVKNFYDTLHFSPLKIHVSFTAQGSDTSALPEFLSILMQSIGVTLTDVHDVIFKLSYFERENVFLNQSMLVSEATSHYTGQFLKQAYVLVLGLDVLGNPYGLVTGLATGVEDLFYEPFQGAIQGPGEFAEGLMIGARSFFGHTVGGAAGAASRITGAMGKGIAALTFDKEYQRKRRLQTTRQATLHEDLAASGKGLVLGFVHGVSGVVTKPIEGAKDDGVEGFVKGVGKGMIGLFTRPAAGVVDFASGSLNAVRRVADTTEETLRSRPPRLMAQDGVTRPYSALEAEGNCLLHELDKGKFIHTDEYVYHIRIINKDLLLLTTRRLLYLTPNELFGGVQVEWEHPWTEFAAPPQSSPKGILIKIKTKKRSGLGGLFGSSGTDKLLLVRNEEEKALVLRKMVECVSIETG